MRRVMVLVIAMAGCRHNEAAQVVDYPAPETVRTIDVRPEPARMWWCYREVNEVTGDGLCSDVRDVCETHHAEHEKFDFVQIVSDLEKDRSANRGPAVGMDDTQLRKVAADVATRRYTECTTSEHAACFSGRRVVDRTTFELCYPTMKRCTFVERNNRNDPDVALTAGCAPR